MTTPATFHTYKTVAEFRETLFLMAEEGVMDKYDIMMSKQPRVEGTDMELVEKYKEAMRAQIESEGKHRFPPVDVCIVEEEERGQVAHIVDGFHRYIAMCHLEFTEIPVRVASNVHPYDAKMYGLSSNMTHGKANSSATVGRMIMLLVGEEEKTSEQLMFDYERWVDTKKATTNKKAIADFCGCAVRTIEGLEAIREYDAKLKKARNLKVAMAKEVLDVKTGKPLSNRQVAELTGVNRQTVNDILSGKKSNDAKNCHSQRKYALTSIDLEDPWEDEELSETLNEANLAFAEKMKAIDKANARGFNTLARHLGEPSKYSGLTKAEKALNTMRTAHASLLAFVDRHKLSDLMACVADDENIAKDVVLLGAMLDKLRNEMAVDFRERITSEVQDLMPS